MNERLLSEGRFVKNAFLPSRRRVSPAELISNYEHEREVELVSRDTAHPDGQVFDELIDDNIVGEQHIRLVKTTKPYNPDFITSAQTLSFLLPNNDYSKRIVTPTAGSFETWQRFMEVNEVCAKQMVDFYIKRGFTDFSLLIGASFNPYTDTNLLRTQSVKAAHVHTFLITDEYLNEARPFKSKGDFINFLSNGVLSPDDVRKDLRRFFRTQIADIFDTVASKRLLSELGEGYSRIEGPSLSRKSTYPLYGISFEARGLDFLSSAEFVDLLQRASRSIESLYDEDVMPIFTENYETIKTSPKPEATPITYRNMDDAVTMFNEKVDRFRKWGITPEQVDRIRSGVKRISGKLYNPSSIKINLGPAYTFSILYDNQTNNSDIFITYNPFGGEHLIR